MATKLRMQITVTPLLLSSYVRYGYIHFFNLQSPVTHMPRITTQKITTDNNDVPQRQTTSNSHTKKTRFRGWRLFINRFTFVQFVLHSSSVGKAVWLPTTFFRHIRTRNLQKAFDAPILPSTYRHLLLLKQQILYLIIILYRQEQEIGAGAASVQFGGQKYTTEKVKIYQTTVCSKYLYQQTISKYALLQL